MEIESKIDTIIEQQVVCNKKYEEIILHISQVENKLNIFEAQIDSSSDGIAQSIQENTSTVSAEIASVRESVKNLSETIHTLSEEDKKVILPKIQSVIDELAIVKTVVLSGQKERTTEINEIIIRSYNQLQQFINNDGSVSREKISSLNGELISKLDVLDSSLRLLLLNSVMDQIGE